MQPKYQRVLLKLSGESLAGSQGSGIDFDVVQKICEPIRECVQMGVQIGLVVGGGNFWRGRSSGKMDRTRADHMGMLATVMNALGVAVASTYTVDDGEFAFYDLEDGVYSVLASAEGYQAAAPMAATILGGSIVNMTVVMTVDTRTYNGTVSGIIRDQKGNAVAGCFVGLFQLVGGVETLVATTKTNTAGKYLFGGVTGGKYLVKAKLEA